MTGEEMLTTLDEHGADAGSDFNDGLDELGWFGWSVGHEGGDTVLTVRFTAEDGETSEQRRWRLEPLT
jgi:hypothetical protein